LRRGGAGNVNVTVFAHASIRVYCAFASLYFKVSIFPKFIAKALGRGNCLVRSFNAGTADNNIACRIHKANLLALTHIERVISSKCKRVSVSGWADNRRSGRRRIGCNPPRFSLFDC
jgi:hypothetical protein